MVKRHIEPGDLDALNLILDRDPTLAGLVIGRLDALNAALATNDKGQPAAGTQTQGPQIQSQTAEIEPKILAWFQAHPGKHSAATVRRDLGIPEGSKPFKGAMQNLIGAKSIKFNDMRGKGALYWLTP